MIRNGGHRHPEPDEIVDLLHGLLPDLQQKTVRAHLEECRECGVLFQELQRAERAARFQAAETARGAPKSLWMGGVGALAAAAVLAAVFWQVRGGEDVAGAADGLFWLPTQKTNVLYRVSTEAPAGEGMVAAIRAYENRDAVAAVDRLEAARDEDPADPVRLLYLASAYQNVGRHQDCLAALRAIGVPSLPPPWRYDALWIAARSHRAVGEEAEARALLRELSAVEGVHGDRARVLLRD